MAEDKREDIERVEGDKAEEERIRTGNGNLINYHKDWTPEQQREFHAAGGRKAQENRKKRKQAAEILDQMLERVLDEKQIEDILGSAQSLLGDDRSLYAVMIAKMAQKACAGDTYTFTVIRDTAGDKPADHHVVEPTLTAEDMALIEKVSKRLGVKLGNDAQSKE